MKATEILMEGSPLEAALRRGWVRIRYTRLDGMTRIMRVTTNPQLFSYTYRRGIKRPILRRVIVVWEHGVGWRALRRNRIAAWQEAGPSPLDKP